MNKDISELKNVLPGFTVIDDKNQDFTVISWRGERLRVFSDFVKAEEWRKKTFKDYFSQNRQQLLYLYELYLGENSWFDYVNKAKLSEWLEDNFDTFTDNRYLHSPYREKTLQIFRDSPIDSIIILTDGDIGLLSEQLYQFCKVSEMAMDIADAMECRVYDKHGLFVVPEVELPKRKKKN